MPHWKREFHSYKECECLYRRKVIMYYLDEINGFEITCEQEAGDKSLMLDFIAKNPATILTRECKAAHMTASSMIFNWSRDKVLMIYHNLYNSWSWTGGHADGETDLFGTAMREAMEETGIKKLRPLKENAVSLDILPVWGHFKRGSYVSSHLHLNLSYLFEADETEALHIKADENSGVGWIPIAQLKEYVSEPDMIPVYEKLIKKGVEIG